MELSLRHLSIDYVLHSKRPVNRTDPLLHRGFGADRKALPIFRVFHHLEVPQYSRWSSSRPVVRTRLGTMATQENIPVIRHPRANKCSRFRIHWNVNTFYLLFRSDKVFN